MNCSICNNNIEGFGHNAQPINDGRCCEVCNIIVTSARLTEFFHRGK